MSKKYKTVLFVFRRDLRLQDNTGLRHALEDAERVLPCFFLDPRQIGQHAYRSTPALNFMGQCLEELDHDLRACGSRLFVFEGIAENVIEALLLKDQIDAVYFNRDYTPFSRNRDRAISRVCEKFGRQAHQFADALLLEPDRFSKPDGKPYTVFTPFFKRASGFPVIKPKPLPETCFVEAAQRFEIEGNLQALWTQTSQGAIESGGRTLAQGILKRLESFKDYQAQRDFPALDATTHLAPHNKFGTVSIREVYWSVVEKLGLGHTLIRELYWRDFFTHIAYHFPRVFGASFHSKYDAIKWPNDKVKFESWCSGRTGFPIVDAGMRELNQTGFMHNRVRMIVASFLTKDLHVDWRWGERYFATKLVDYDPSVNNGNWQWAASTGCDAQPYFRIFNPWLQQEKFDPDCLYVKRWLPELSKLSAKTIHGLGENSASSRSPIDYPFPIVDHAESKAIATSLYEEI